MWLSACAGSPTPSPRTERAQAAASRGDDAERGPSARASARDLRPDASFADLVAAARRQDELRDQDSSAGCLLRLGPPARLEADLAAAVRPLPEPPPALEERLGEVAVLTRYEAFGRADAPLQLAAFTTSRPPRGRAVGVLAITRSALFLGRTGAGERFRELDRARLATLDDGVSALFVTADAGVSVRRLAEVLAALGPMAGRVGLAVALPEGVRRPEGELPEDETAPLCELPEPSDEGVGELARDALARGVAPLGERVPACTGGTSGAGARGGRVVLQFRVDADGRVREACVVEDETDDGVLRACLLRAARELSFPAPVGGSLDVALPLSIRPADAFQQRALCD